MILVVAGTAGKGTAGIGGAFRKGGAFIVGSSAMVFSAVLVSSSDIAWAAVPVDFVGLAVSFAEVSNAWGSALANLRRWKSRS